MFLAYVIRDDFISEKTELGSNLKSMVPGAPEKGSAGALGTNASAVTIPLREEGAIGNGPLNLRK